MPVASAGSVSLCVLMSCSCLGETDFSRGLGTTGPISTLQPGRVTRSQTVRAPRGLSESQVHPWFTRGATKAQGLEMVCPKVTKGITSLTLPALLQTNHLPGTLAPLPAPTKDGWSCPHSSPDPGEGNARNGQLGIKSHVAKGLADHHPPLPGNDGQGPETGDPCRGRSRQRKALSQRFSRSRGHPPPTCKS